MRGAIVAGSALGEALSSAAGAGANSPTAGAAGADGGAGGASEGGAGGDPSKFDGDPCLDVSGRGQPASLPQLVGDWHYFPYDTDDVEKTFIFQADGTASLYIWVEGFHPGQFTTTDYSGTFEVTADALVLHMTNKYFSNGSAQPSQSSDVDETFEYPYAYDAKSETLYVGETDCIAGKPAAYTHWTP